VIFVVNCCRALRGINSDMERTRTESRPAESSRRPSGAAAWRPGTPAPPVVEGLLACQRAAGNRAVMARLRAGPGAAIGGEAAEGRAAREAARAADDAVRSPGRPLDPAARAFLEPRFGRDLGAVRVHTGARSDASARALGADAFAVGRDLVFAGGRYAPGEPAGRRLLAHELAHVFQPAGRGPVLRRRLRVNRDHPPASIAPQDPLQDPAMSLAPGQRLSMMDGVLQGLSDAFEVDSTSGDVRAKGGAVDRPALAAGSRPAGGCGLAVLVESTVDPPWTIQVSQAAGPHTRPSSREVVLPPTNTTFEYGSYSVSGARTASSVVVVAGHELCGHAALMEIDAHPPPQDRTRTDVHDPTVRIENRIAGEQGVPPDQLRGLARSGPHRGESLAHLVIEGFEFNHAGIPPGQNDKIRWAAAFIRTNNSYVDVFGHSDAVGSPSAKQQISDQRASRVRQALLDAGVAWSIDKHGWPVTQRIHTYGRSDSDPPPPPRDADPANWRRADIYCASYPAGAETLPPRPAGFPADVEPHVQNPNVPALKASPDPCVALLVNTAYP
jgi:outer membrane protein OmpA-like peptidoglycan-associated protein